jgi:2-dehydro-3-deoxyphosphogluconate aldolase/(4S)-4-hydroxy-2-oxoglutarate aldolase
MRAARHGVEAVKFFPADRLGEPAAIRALSGLFPGMGFVPSGGVTLRHAVEDLADPAVPAVSDSWMANRSMISSRDFDAIEQATAASVTALGDA